MAEQLSPAAQAVLDAYRSSHLSLNNLAAALEELADQVQQKWQGFSYETCQEIRAIAAELRGQ